MTEQAQASFRAQIPMLVIIMLGMFLSVLNQTLLNVAIPHLITEFNVTATDAEWLLTGYLLVNGILIPLSAYLIERFGMRTLFIVAMAFFTGGSIICGIAPAFSILLIGRILQACGAGILMPLGMVTILALFPPEKRGRGMGIFGLGIMFAPAIGPTLSGWILEHYGWRLLFNGIAPLGFIVLVLSLFLLKNIQQINRERKLDVLGTILSTIGFGALLYGLSEAGSKGWDDEIVVITLIAGFLSIILFVLQQLRSEQPMLDFRIFRYGIFTLSSIISMIITVGMFGGLFLVPIYLQTLRGYTPLESGLLLLPGAIIAGILQPVSGIVFDKVGPRPLAIIGMLITLITTYEFTNLTLGTSYLFIMVLYSVRMIGIGILMMPITTAGINQLPNKKNAHGTALSNTSRQISGSIGISLITTIFTNRTTFHMGLLRDSVNTMDPQFQQAFFNRALHISQSTGIPIEQAKAVLTNILYGQMNLQSAVSGIQDAFYWTTGVTVVGLILSLFLRDVRKKEKRTVPMIEQPKVDPPKLEAATN